MNKYVVIHTKAGYIVQNSQTHYVVGVYTEKEALRICQNLNQPTKEKPVKVYNIGDK